MLTKTMASRILQKQINQKLVDTQAFTYSCYRQWEWDLPFLLELLRVFCLWFLFSFPQNKLPNLSFSMARSSRGASAWSLWLRLWPCSGPLGMLYGAFAFSMCVYSESLIWMDWDLKALQELQLGFPILLLAFVSS